MNIFLFSQPQKFEFEIQNGFTASGQNRTGLGESPPTIFSNVFGTSNGTYLVLGTVIHPLCMVHVRKYFICFFNKCCF